MRLAKAFKSIKLTVCLLPEAQILCTGLSLRGQSSLEDVTRNPHSKYGPTLTSTDLVIVRCACAQGLR